MPSASDSAFPHDRRPSITSKSRGRGRVLRSWHRSFFSLDVLQLGYELGTVLISFYDWPYIYVAFDAVRLPIISTTVLIIQTLPVPNPTTRTVPVSNLPINVCPSMHSRSSARLVRPRRSHAGETRTFVSRHSNALPQRGFTNTYWWFECWLGDRFTPEF